jgi:hypothetical protein
MFRTKPVVNRNFFVTAQSRCALCSRSDAYSTPGELFPPDSEIYLQYFIPSYPTSLRSTFTPRRSTIYYIDDGSDHQG